MSSSATTSSEATSMATTKERCRVVICGASGNMGKIRTKLVYGNPRFELCGVCDINIQAAQEISSLYSTKAVDDRSTLITTEKLDGLIICVPTPHHGQYIKEGAKHQLTIFVEKPVADDPKDLKNCMVFVKRIVYHYVVDFNVDSTEVMLRLRMLSVRVRSESQSVHISFLEIRQDHH
jgi:hypothetical protein